MKVLLIGCILTTMISAQQNLVIERANSGHLETAQSLQEVKLPRVEQAVKSLNSYTAQGIYAVGHGMEMLGTGLKYVGWGVSAAGATFMAFEKTVVSGIITPLSYAVQGGLEYGAWNTSSKAISLGLKDLADTVESRGAKSSYLGKIACLFTYGGASVSFVGHGFSWLGKKMCGYAESI